MCSFRIMSWVIYLGFGQRNSSQTETQRAKPFHTCVTSSRGLLTYSTNPRQPNTLLAPSSLSSHNQLGRRLEGNRQGCHHRWNASRAATIGDTQAGLPPLVVRKQGGHHWWDARRAATICDTQAGLSPLVGCKQGCQRDKSRAVFISGT